MRRDPVKTFIDDILERASEAQQACTRFIESIDAGMTEDFLQLLLKAMSLVFMIHPEYRKNIEHFQGRYVFRSIDDKIGTSVIFENDKMTVLDKVVDHPHVTVNFRNPRALRDYILSPKPDILGALLRQDVVPDGNLNYLYKFAFMAKRLQLMATGQA
jgi:hypothetical protein